MSETTSNILPQGFSAPDFKLLEPLTGKMLSLAELKSEKATLIMFICNHCPFVKHVNAEIVRIASEYIPVGISVIAINSSDVELYPEESPEKMVQKATRLGYPFPYLYDKTQEVALKYKASCTPDFYLFDDKMKLAYHGQMDDSRPANNVAVTGKDLRRAIRQLLKNEPVASNQKPSIGCSIKWSR